MGGEAKNYVINHVTATHTVLSTHFNMFKFVITYIACHHVREASERLGNVKPRNHHLFVFRFGFWIFLFGCGLGILTLDGFGIRSLDFAF